jgi:hypothetical protein
MLKPVAACLAVSAGCGLLYWDGVMRHSQAVVAMIAAAQETSRHSRSEFRGLPQVSRGLRDLAQMMLDSWSPSEAVQRAFATTRPELWAAAGLVVANHKLSWKDVHHSLRTNPVASFFDTESGKASVTHCIIGANVAVYLLWQAARRGRRLSLFMERHFLVKPGNPSTCKGLFFHLSLV